MKEKYAECKESTKEGLLLKERRASPWWSTTQAQRRLWILPFQAFFRFCAILRLPGGPVGLLWQVKCTLTDVSEDKLAGQHAHWRWRPRFRTV